MREAWSLRVIGGGTVRPCRTIPGVDEHDVSFLDAALGESLRREDVLDVLLRKGIARRERVAVVQIPGGIQQDDGGNNRFRFVDAQTLETGGAHHLTLRETTEVRRSLSWLSDKPKVPKRIHLGTLLAEFSADVFAITGMPEDSSARIGCRPVRTKEHSGVRREGPRGGKRGLRGRRIHQVTHFDFDRRDPRGVDATQ